MKRPLALAAILAISATSYPALAQDGARMIEQMREADANNDGAVSRAELQAYRARQFDRLDRNDDGVLSDSDLPRIPQIRDKIKARTAAYDTNRDGRITRAEFTGGPTIAFDRADTNNDGFVTTAELNAARAVLEREFGK